MSTLYFPAPGDVENYCNKPEEYNRVSNDESLLSAELKERLSRTGRTPKAGDVKYIFVTKSGPGPILQPAEEHLLNAESGLPVEPGPKHKRMKIGE